MSKHIQYGTITATSEQLQDGGYKTLRNKQRVVVESVLFNLKLVLVKADQYTNSFFVITREFVELESEQLTLQFD